jgi:hypothetical protein
VTAKKPSDLAASIRQRLLDRAKARSEDYNFTLSQYAGERFLFRLSRSKRRDRFVLKGATAARLRRAFVGQWPLGGPWK